MSALGHYWTSRHVHHVRFTPNADIVQDNRDVRFVLKADICTAAIVPATIGGNREFSATGGAG
jgi:hypothetical protein